MLGHEKWNENLMSDVLLRKFVTFDLGITSSFRK
ncbi:hypothetical protein RDI58_024156 [Solanum bulbocastanum]|uniref:Uncharacterized protein n=1 Tax=Solanum bulbocastanum TaxID=147425 RepID=A0AAN8T0I8_SOLBU